MKCLRQCHTVVDIVELYGGVWSLCSFLIMPGAPKASHKATNAELRPTNIFSNVISNNPMQQVHHAIARSMKLIAVMPVL